MSLGNEREFIDHLQKEVKGGKAMKCPLKFRLTDYGAEVERIYTGDCLKEECAWWDAKFDGCSILELNRTLYLIHEYIEEITKKMPHAGQFLK